jgi:hypothetical protein
MMIMNGKIWNEAVVIYFKVLTQHSPWETGENNENPQAKQPVPRLKFETGISRKQ